jgi:hypothetical protein
MLQSLNLSALELSIDGHSNSGISGKTELSLLKGSLAKNVSLS